MTYAIRHWAWESGLKGNDKWVLVALTEHAGVDGMTGEVTCYPSHATIAKMIDVNPRTVMRATQSLAELGFIEVRRRNRPDGQGRTSNLYVLHTEVTLSDNLSPRNSAVLSDNSAVLSDKLAVLSDTLVSQEQPIEQPIERSAPETPKRLDVEDLCLTLAGLIEGNGSKRPTITAGWRTQARLILDADGRNIDDVKAVMRWCQADTFWKPNILSMTKFRDKYDTLRLQAERDQPVTATSTAEWRPAPDVDELIARDIAERGTDWKPVTPEERARIKAELGIVDPRKTRRNEWSAG